MIYLYRCPNGHEVEADYPMGKQPDEVDCTRCDEMAVRVFTVPQVVFKGWDWASKKQLDPMDPKNDIPQEMV